MTSYCLCVVVVILQMNVGLTFGQTKLLLYTLIANVLISSLVCLLWNWISNYNLSKCESL